MTISLSSATALVIFTVFIAHMSLCGNAQSMVEFLFQNQKLCGNPFSEAQWVPVLDMCEMNCNKNTELCMENDEMKQKCSKLSDECVKAYRASKRASRRSKVGRPRMTTRLATIATPSQSPQKVTTNKKLHRKNIVDSAEPPFQRFSKIL